jgi:hypothetical protein
MAEMPLALRLVLTAVFGSVGWYCVRRCAGPAGSADWLSRVNYAAHLAMSTAMIAMVWASARWAPWQMALFGVACGWFLIQATGLPLSRASAWRPAKAGTARSVDRLHRGPAHRLRCLHHALVMAGTVWMLAVVSPMPAGLAPMAGGTMSGGAMSGGTMSGGFSGVTSRLAGVAGACCVAGALLLAVAGRRASRGRSDPVAGGHGAVANDLYHALMTAGMGVMLLAGA